jgi:hypothetical protein
MMQIEIHISITSNVIGPHNDANGNTYFSPYVTPTSRV